MGQLLAAIDVAVAPHSRMDGDFYFCPLKILEYAASGCATIASAQGDIPLLLADGRGGVILADDCIESWLEAISSLVDESPRRKMLGETAREHVLGRFTWSDTAQRVESVLECVLGRHRSSRLGRSNEEILLAELSDA